MKTQLIQLSTLLRLLDLSFWNYLGKCEGAESYEESKLSCTHWHLESLKMESGDTQQYFCVCVFQSHRIRVISISVSAGC